MVLPPALNARKILHLDLDAFFCAVEEQQTPNLKGKPFAVGGRPDQRGVVASCSYAARQFGVRSAMPMSVALRQCPSLQVVPPNFKAYRAASAAVMARLQALTELVEQLSIDEAFLDISTLPTDPAITARQLQQQISTELNLPCSLGVANNKLVAKIANNVGKAAARGPTPPNAITIVPPGQEAAFLAPLPVSELWGVGPKTTAQLQQLEIHTIGELAAYPATALQQRFGQHGVDMARHARGEDDRPIQTEREIKSISQERTFALDVRDVAVLQQALEKMSHIVVDNLAKHELVASTIKIKLRWHDFTTLTRQITVAHPTADFQMIYGHALKLLAEHWPPGRPVRLIGVGVSGLTNYQPQLTLWDWQAADARQQHLEEALAVIRARFGDQAVRSGRDLTE